MELVGPIEWPIQPLDQEPVYFDMYYTVIDGDRYIISTLGDLDDEPIPLRIESACIFGHVFQGVHCDCGDQWRKALSYIKERGKGMAIYSVDDDARGHGIEMHFELYVLRQHHGMDEEDIFEEKGKEMDIRSYRPVVDILEEFSVDTIDLMTNNPERINYLEEHDITINERVPLQAEITEYNEQLLLEEKDWMGYQTSYKTHEEWCELFESKAEEQAAESGYLVTKGHETVLEEQFQIDGTLNGEDFEHFDGKDGFVTLYVGFDHGDEFVDDARQYVDKVIDVKQIIEAENPREVVKTSPT